jgi:DNA (cytosine-5)-methyltransferase 1
MNELALFAGAGGGILGSHLLGWRTVCAVEWDPYAAGVLLARQNDGLLPPFPVWDDVQSFDGRPWRGIVDVVSGGFPCQDISVAGKGAGIDGERSGMWAHMARIVGDVRPRFVFVENSPAIVTRGLGRVLGDLAALGYDCRWTVLGAADVGAPHQRDRFWLVAHASGERHELAEQAIRAGRHAAFVGSEMAHAHGLRQLQPQRRICDERGRVGDSGTHVADTERPGTRREADSRIAPHPDESSQGMEEGARRWFPGLSRSGYRDSRWWSTEPDVGRVANGVAARVDRLKAIGNGQVPAVAAAAWRLLAGGDLT